MTENIGLKLNGPTASRDVLVCPACESADYVEIGSRAPAFAVSVGIEQFVQLSYSVHECLNCTLLYRTPVPVDEVLARYYAAVDFRKWEIQGHYPTEKKVLSALKGLPQGSRILDFGCSSGRLLAPLCQDYQCYGIEVNRAAAQRAAAKGLRILSQHEIKASEGIFDAVTLVDVFEHLSQPLDELKRLCRLLVEDGLLIVATGNGDAALCRRDPAQFWYFRIIEHICMMTRKHAEFIARRLRMDLKEWVEVSHYDGAFRERLLQRLRHFAYWQFQTGGTLSRACLSLIPRVRRAKNWAVAPAFTYSIDHVVAIFCKRGER